jgi:hypothetical protein
MYTGSRLYRQAKDFAAFLAERLIGRGPLYNDFVTKFGSGYMIIQGILIKTVVGWNSSTLISFKTKERTMKCCVFKFETEIPKILNGMSNPVMC